MSEAFYSCFKEEKVKNVGRKIRKKGEGIGVNV